MSPGPSLRSATASGVAWNAVQMWAVRATTALAFIVISRQLQPSEFGLVALAMSVIAVLQLLSDSGMASFLIRQEELDEHSRSTAFWTSVVLAVVLAGVLVLLSVPVSGWFGEPDLAPVLQVLSIGIVLTGVNSVPTALLRRDLRFKTLAVRGTVATLVGSVVAIVLALLGAGVWALVAQNLVRGVVGIVILWTSVQWLPRVLPRWTTARSMLAFGSKLLTIDLMRQVQNRGEEFTLAGVGGSTTLGYWSVATRLMRIVTETGSSVISSVTLSTFSRLQNDRDRLHRAYRTSMTAAGLVMFPALLFMAAASPDLVPFLLGQQWATTATVAQITALTAAFSTFGYFDRQVFIAVDRLRPEVVLVAATVVAHLAIVVVLARYGLVVLAWGLLGRTLLTLPARQVLLHRVAGTPYRTVVLPCRVLLASAVMGALVAGQLWLCADLAQWLRLLLAVVVAALTYPLALLVLARPAVEEFRGDAARILSRVRRTPRRPPAADAVDELVVPDAPVSRP
ncbi:lipopolysaccharide biosynthesis protein [Kineococcus rhizosphaerae]|uniref:O-antigen/teichoic acid export membrane protein n=1 Tax=Kineococcus rhizosphaerae TaxID=559628 RepID=A0A2T0R0Y7_9ACTN|nr:lipopolysaccharide biosynthesis protein [Kineococcus rhizosphaerae]PRY12949.1 O-antigen/teichoic acid export membrane protein [Kineococcus rhizosphaerae]